MPDHRLSTSLRYGADVLRQFSADRRSVGIAELADAIGLSRSTAHRYASTLVQLGYVQQGNKRRYVLAPGSANPGLAAIREMRQEIRADAILNELRSTVGCTVSLGVLDKGQVTYLYRLHAHGRGQHEADRELRTGSHIPVHCTAMGKVLLASLSEADRRQCLAEIKLTAHTEHTVTNLRRLMEELRNTDLRAPLVSDEEFTLGARSIAMFVSTVREHPVAIDVTTPARAHTVRQLLDRAGPPLKRAASLMSGTQH